MGNMRDWDPNQPRDPDGKWGEGGGGSSSATTGAASGASATSPSPTTRAVEKESSTSAAPRSKEGHVDFANSDKFQAEKYARGVSREWAEKLSFSEKDAIASYTSSGHREINSSLRRGESGDLRVQDLDAAIARSSLAESQTFYRAGAVPASKLQVGSVITDKGYASVSMSPHIAQTFQTGKGNAGGALPGGLEMAVWKINAPKGSRVAVLGKTSSNPGESEALFPRGSMFRITKIESSPRGNIIHAEYTQIKRLWRDGQKQKAA